MQVPVEKLTKAYIKIREKRAELSANFKDEDAKLADKMNTIKRALLDHCEEHSVESVRTTEGLFYRTVKQRNKHGHRLGRDFLMVWLLFGVVLGSFRCFFFHVFLTFGGAWAILGASLGPKGGSCQDHLGPHLGGKRGLE